MSDAVLELSPAQLAAAYAQFRKDEADAKAKAKATRENQIRLTKAALAGNFDVDGFVATFGEPVVTENWTGYGTPYKGSVPMVLSDGTNVTVGITITVK